MNNFIISLKDFFTFRFLAFSLFPLIISSIIFISLLTLAFSYVGSLDFNEEAFNFFLGAMILHAIQIFIMIITISGGGFLALYLSIFFALVITSFLTPMIVREINLKHYNYNKLDEIGLIQITWLLFKIVLKFLFFLFFVLLFHIIPILNFIASFLMFCLMFYLFFNFLIYDVASCVLNKNDFLSFKPFKFKYIFCVFLFYLASNIPYVGFFLPVFFVIFLAHLLFQNELRLKQPLN
ncbi:EI24 domain-containing protein [Campylobacter sp. RM12640]|uniref:EI24 domain-containing protein n=1 Tax=unclassified Campylobacter TaxID=2593542 RepID=UPI001BDAC3EB|nr:MULTISPECIES: EI24 domain-containing protein [unclassified Campylobacter]MBZ7978499.1 EI24 domain-containing protein [Campylobacter sp. RM12654]MBZ7980840.1 EI24 domain-containing protein [Campylobacter sp. RM12642]MBZ7982791.1 EI24 domain-containing protein [Campylobacter sp. RM12640]MBZ7990069.1 EI24 domain-containing protein [Campylobacter sp. RM12635]MBZ8007587.1 EI24 domain-containing protein [Campylobacter sp. RM9334]